MNLLSEAPHAEEAPQVDHDERAEGEVVDEVEGESCDAAVVSSDVVVVGGLDGGGVGASPMGVMNW